MSAKYKYLILIIAILISFSRLIVGDTVNYHIGYNIGPKIFITDVNLPEHRGTAFSVANIASSLGRTLGNVGFGFLLAIVSAYTDEPHNFIITLIILQLPLIPSAFCYIKMAKNNIEDIREVKSILCKRSNLT